MGRERKKRKSQYGIGGFYKSSVLVAVLCCVGLLFEHEKAMHTRRGQIEQERSAETGKEWRVILTFLPPVAPLAAILVY